MNKLEENGMVAVVYSPGYGAGWSSWNDPEYAEFLTMDGHLARLVLDKKFDEIKTYLDEKFGEDMIYIGGCQQLKIEWVQKGSQFEITSYDGLESVHVIGNRVYLTT